MLKSQPTGSEAASAIRESAADAVASLARVIDPNKGTILEVEDGQLRIWCATRGHLTGHSIDLELARSERIPT